MAEFPATLQNLFTFAFVVSSMLAMGLSLTGSATGTPADMTASTGEHAAGI